MGRAFEIVSAFATAPSTGAAGAACTGNSLTIRKSDKPISLLALTALQQATVGARILTSPFLHDTSNGIRINEAVSQVSQTNFYIPQTLQPQDTLSLTIAGSAVAGDIEHTALHIFYEDLPGVDGKYISTAMADSQIEQIYAVPLTVSAVATGQYGTGVALNSSQDQFRANQDYAILGAQCSGTLTASMALRILGPDLGNIGCGIPLLASDVSEASHWFYYLSDLMGMPLIPVINSANKTLTTVAQVGNENAATLNVALIMGLLGKSRSKRKG